VRFLFRLSNRRFLNTLAPIHVSPGKNPFTERWFDTAFEQHDSAIQSEYGAGYDLGILIEDKRTRVAHETFGFGRLHDLLIESAAAAGAETVFNVTVRVVLLMV